jgi:hypothetical protein
MLTICDVWGMLLSTLTTMPINEYTVIMWIHRWRWIFSSSPSKQKNCP